MKKHALTAIVLCGWAAVAARAEFQGRVVDMHRLPLPGVRVTIQPEGMTSLTDSNGTFRLTRTSAASVRHIPNRTAFLPVPRLGFLMARETPALDFQGRRANPDGSRWLILTPLSSSAAAPAMSAQPLAKVSPANFLTAEKHGYLTGRITLNSDATIPDIHLVRALDWSLPVPGASTPKPTVNLNPNRFNSSTSTEIPNTYLKESVICALTWKLELEPGIQVYIRSHTYFPRFPEKDGFIEPDGVSSHLEPDFQVSTEELAVPDWTNTSTGIKLEPIPGHSEYVNLLLRTQASDTNYGSMTWLRFPGPVPTSQNALRSMPPSEFSKIKTVFSGPVPPLETCGRLAGKVVWKGADPQPELWIGMIGTDLFAAVAPDGSFLSTDLPPGTPPLALVRVDRQGDGAAVPRAFHNLEGLAVVSGQTSLLDSIILSAE